MSHQVVVVAVFSKWISNPTDPDEHLSHAVVLFDQDKDYYYIKNSSHLATPHGDKVLKISKTQMTYDKFCNPQTARDATDIARFLRKNRTFTDENLLLGDMGMTMVFR